MSEDPVVSVNDRSVFPPPFSSRDTTTWQSLWVEERLSPPEVEAANIDAEPDFEITVVLQGSFTIECWQGRGWHRETMQTGSVALTPPNRPELLRWRAVEPTVLRTAHLYLSHRLLAEAAGDLGVLGSPAQLPKALNITDTLISAVTTAVLGAARAGADPLYADSAASFLARHLLTTRATSRPETNQTVVRRVLRVLAGAAERPTTLADLAREARVGPTRFARIVKDATGHTTWQQVSRLRIERAQRLLAETDASMTDIAYRCGFATPSHFASTFRGLTGSTPTAWRHRIAPGRPQVFPDPSRLEGEDPVADASGAGLVAVVQADHEPACSCRPQPRRDMPVDGSAHTSPPGERSGHT